jgi:phosphoribosylglycinamide formyltransferase-1
MRILTDEFVTHYLGQLINIHPSLLPKYKGLNTHQRAMDNGDSEHGVSVHFVTPELDDGPVILQAKVPIFSDDDADMLAQRVQVQEHHIYPLVVKWFVEGRLLMRSGKAVMDDQCLGPNGFASDE